MDPEKFKAVEQKYKELNEQLNSALISPDEMKKTLKKMMIQDNEGHYWMIGGKSGKWYMYNGTEWKEGVPYQEEELYQEDFEELLSPEYQTAQPDSKEETVQVESLDKYQESSEDEYQTVDLNSKANKQGSILDHQSTEGQDVQVETAGNYNAGSILDEKPQSDQDYTFEAKQEYQLEEKQPYKIEEDKSAYQLESHQSLQTESKVAGAQDFGGIDASDFQVEYNGADSNKTEGIPGGETFRPSILDEPTQPSVPDEASNTSILDEPSGREESDITQLYSRGESETVRLDSPLATNTPTMGGDETQIEEPITGFGEDSNTIQLDEPISPFDDKKKKKKKVIKEKRSKRDKANKPDLTTKKISKPETKNDELVITAINMVSLIFFMGGIGMIVGVLFGATFGIFTDIFGEMITFFPEILQGTQGGLAGGLIFAAIGGIGGFIAFAIAAMVISSIYNLIAFIFGGIRFKVK